MSPDGVASHRRFKQKHALPYTLLADTEHAVAVAYGVWKQRSLFGHKYMGIERTTYVIDAEGRVAKVFEKVDPKGHAAEVADAINAILRRPHE